MGWSPDRDALRDRVAVVAGATRGAGRGIAAALGEAGATVICTGRSSTARTIRSDCNRAETIEETSDLVTQLGGTGIAVAVDHLEASQVKGLAEQIRNNYGHIDVLVNDIWGAEALKGGPADPAEWNTPIWEHDLGNGLRILRLVIDTHLITSHHLLPLLINEPGGLLVEVTDGTTDYNTSRYRISSDSPRFIGRAVVALASDPNRARWNQKSVNSGQLATEYGFTDLDGSQPDIWRFIEEIREPGLDANLDDYR
ncbi:MAG: SDR family NAD(P)-dependent oxidoreductase [Actinomycetota bacterium]|nr:SDR family NAD(P)-dependent oxidoreductase [Actinomycetota bacterium]